MKHKALKKMISNPKDISPEDIAQYAIYADSGKLGNVHFTDIVDLINVYTSSIDCKKFVSAPAQEKEEPAITQADVNEIYSMARLTDCFYWQDFLKERGYKITKEL